MRTIIIAPVFIVMLFFPIHQVHAQSDPLNGTYTIGTGGNYTTLTSAIDSLVHHGINGPVLFNLKDGSYNEQIIIPEINGASANNTITFQSENDDSSRVIIYYYGDYDNNYIIKLNGADHIIFRKLTLEAANAYYTRALVLDSSANHNRFESNIIRNQNSSYYCESCSPDGALVYSAYDFNNNYNSFTNNLFENGDYGLYCDNAKGTIINKNIFKNQIIASIYLYNQDSVIIKSNITNSISDYYDFHAIFGSNFTNYFGIEKNKIIIPNAGNGIFLDGCSGTVSQYGSITNNFVAVGGTVSESDLTGITMLYCSYINLIYNSIYINSPDQSYSKALKINYGNQINLKNNIFNNSGGGYALYNWRSSTIDSSDYNDIYSTGLNLVYWSGNYSSLTDFQLESGMDLNSISINPYFISFTDLHVSDAGLNGKASPVSSPDDDIDGQIRDLSFPDIGADEFTPPQTDAGIVSVEAPKMPFERGNNIVSVQIKNFGIDPLINAVINWTVNGLSQPGFSWSGNLSAGEAELVNIGSFDFSGNLNNTIKSWTTQPNGIPDGINSNDTIQVNNLVASLSGTYTIGGLNPDFVNFQEVESALYNYGVAGNVVFKIRNGTYDGQISIWDVRGASKLATVTFESESGDNTQVILSYAYTTTYNNFIIRLIGADYVTFNNITISGINTSYGRLIEIGNGSNYNTVKNCILKGVVPLSSWGDQSIIYSPTSIDEYNAFTNNRFINGNYGFYYDGDYSVREKGTRIENNIFENQEYYALRVSAQDSIIIQNNTITSTTYSSYFYGISCSNSVNQLSINKNKIYLPNGGTGIQLSSCNRSGEASGLIANNFITIGGDGNANGITLEYSENQRIYSNNILVTSVSGRALYISDNSNSPGNTSVVNNILVNNGGGYCYFVSSPLVITISDYNDFYTTGQYLGIWSGYITDLSQLQSANGKDLHSISIDPQFISLNDLHVTESSVNNAGTPLTVITEDIDGDSRNALNPDIGADEFNLTNANDAGMVAFEGLEMPFIAGNKNVFVVVKNFGADPLNSLAIDWSVNNVLQPRHNWSGTLASGDTIKINIGAYSFILKTNFTINSWTSLPNGQSDPNNSNDTIKLTNLYAGLNGSYTIGGTTPDFQNFTEAVATLNQGGIAGNVTFKVRNGTYNEQIALSKISGASKNRTVSFESESGVNSDVILSYSAGAANNYTLQLTGTQYVTFYKLTILATATIDYGNVITILNNSNHNTFSNCIFKSLSTNSVIISTLSYGNNNNSFYSNKIINGNYGIYYDGGANGTHIENNIFENQNVHAIYLSYQDSLVVLKNSFNTNSSIPNYTALYCNGCNESLKIEKNRIAVPSGGYGIQLYACNGLYSSPGLIANNFIQIGGSSWSVGINCTSSSYQSIYNNNINITNNNITSRAFSITDNYDYYRNIDLRNNILSNSGGGYALYSTFKNSLSISDNNDLFTTGTNLAYWTSNKANLAELRLISQKDSNSVSINPQFFSETDLHVKEITLNSAGKPLSIITDDIDGDVRDLNFPDIGADEFENKKHDVGVTAILPSSGCLLGSDENVKVTVKNFGAYPESGIAVVYLIDNASPVIENISQTIPAGGSVNYTFNKKVNFSVIKSYKLTTNSVLPGDEYHANDTIVSLISNMPKLNIRLTNDTIICNGNNITLTASGADTYIWNTGQTTNSVNVWPSGTTSYIVRSTNYFKCEAIDTVTVRVNPIPAAPIITASGPTAFCNDSSVVLTSSIPDNIIWSTQEKTQSITVKNTGWYYVKFTDSNSCSSISTSIYVSKEPAPIVTPRDTTICSAQSITLRVKNAVSYLWSNGSTTQSITVNPLVTSAYSVTATTALGCTVTANSTINILPSKTPGPVTGMVPANEISGLSLPFGISWMPSENASYYDLYLWPQDETKPTKAYANNINGIRYNFIDASLAYGKTYNWQIVAKYFGCESTPGPVQTLMLRHLPDLIINNVQIPKSAFTGQEIEITWDVKNQGLGSTGNQTWSDNLSLSLDRDTVDDFYSLGYVNNMTFLEPGQSYSKKGVFRLPQYKDGIFNIFAWANRGKQLLENNYSNNQGRSNDTLFVKLAPTPDLFVNEVITPSDFFSEDTINISWKVSNKGKWRTEKKSWTDRVYISQDYNTSKRHLLGDFIHSGDTLRPGEIYSTTQSVIIPEGIFGRFYFYVETDITNVIQEHAFDGNNLTQSDSVNVILRPPADLEVSDIIIPKNVTNIGTANIRWKVTNIGNSSPRDNVWYDAIYLSKSPVFDAGKSLKFYFSRTGSNGIPLSFGYNNSENIRIPNNILAGEYYVYIKTDNNDDVFEYTFNENNLLRSDTTINISIAPWPDLIVTELILPDSAGAGETIPVNYTVTNRGAVAAKGGWSDRFYISGRGYANAFLKEIKRYDNLNIDSSYTVNTNLVLPAGFDNGSSKYKVTVITDSSNTVYEHTNKNNNRLSDFIFIKPSDLAIQTINVPASVYSGSNLAINFMVQNTGDASTPAGYWYDRALILDSLNNPISGNIENLSGRYGPVKPGQSYSYTNNFVIPDGISGNYSIRLTTDYGNSNHERITSNNTKIIPFKILFRQPTDLIINTLSMPQTGTSGQPVTINWEVKNSGPGITMAPFWTDILLLSQDTVIDDKDISLGTFPNSNRLASGGTYNKSELVFLPINTIGNYYVIAKTDFSSYLNTTGAEYEFHAEDNNTRFSLITINLAPPSDLIVSAISVPANAIAGESVTVGWTIKNLGPNKSEGYLTDMIYFSTDTVWDIDDLFFGEKTRQVNLNPDQEVSSSLTTELAGPSSGNYYVLVRTDNKNNINEVTDLNNTLYSASPVNVDVKLLKLNISENKVLFNNKGLYYRLEIPDSLIDETLLISLAGDTISGANELFISYGKVPDRSDYDFNSRTPFYGNQEVIVPALKKGTYYLLVYGNVTAGNQQNIKILASIIHFQVRSVDANKGGNKGSLTAEMYGAKFTGDMRVKLQNPSHTIEADSLIFVDATKVFVTFNLMDAPLGFYDVVAVSVSGDTTLLKNGFEVVENSPFGLVTSVKAPGAMRINTFSTIAVQYANDGNIDLPIPRFLLISEDNLNIAFIKKDLDKNQTELVIELRELNGPQHILRPGAVNSLYIWVAAPSIRMTAHFRFE